MFPDIANVAMASSAPIEWKAENPGNLNESATWKSS